jgi:hypothetical protein
MASPGSSSPRRCRRWGIGYGRRSIAGHGGKRQGAGRPTDAAREQKRTAGAQAIQRFAEQALKDLDDLYQAQKQLALGIYYEGCSACSKEVGKCRCKEGPSRVRVYQLPPNQKAGAELIAQAKGKAATAQQVQQETQITVSLGCRKCGGYDPLVPRPAAKRERDAEDGGGRVDGAGAEGAENAGEVGEAAGV